MKKLFTVLLAFMLVVALLVGCRSTAAQKSAGKSDASTSNEKTYKFKLGYNTVVDSLRGEMAIEFKKIVEEKSGGRMTVDIYPAEALGSEQEQIESVKLGVQDFSLPGGGAMSNVDPLFGATTLPFLFKSYEDAHAKLDGALGDYFKQLALDNGYKILGYGDLGFAQITNSKRPINSIADMKGINLRSPNEPVLMNTMKNLGASVTPLPFTEVYIGLQQGVVDGQFNPVDAIYQTKFHEVQDYLAIANVFYYNVDFITNTELWNELSDSDKVIIQEAADAAIEISRNFYKEGDAKYMNLMQDSFKEITSPDTTEFRTAVQPVYDEFTKDAPDEFKGLLNK